MRRATKNAFLGEGEVTALHVVLSLANEVPQIFFFKVLLCLHKSNIASEEQAVKRQQLTVQNTNKHVCASS